MFAFYITLFLNFTLAQEPSTPPDSSEENEEEPGSKEEKNTNDEQQKKKKEDEKGEQNEEEIETEAVKKSTSFSAEPQNNQATPAVNSGETMEPELTKEQEETLDEEPTIEDLLQQIDEGLFDIPLVYNQQVQYWVEHFSTRGRWTVSKWIRDSGKYSNLIRKELRKAGLPQDLLYLAMIESGFDPNAESTAQAVGVWQFIPSTARTYGLTVNDVIDERRDPVRSTQAAIAYLSKLYREFGNWHLAMAAYNAGENRAYKAIGEQGTINYWELCQHNALPLETREYVPRLIAVAILDRYPTLFGIPSTIRKAEPLVVKTSYADRNQHVQTLADAAEISLETFMEYNPHILAERLRIEEPEIIIYLPPNKADVYQQNIRRLGANRLTSGRSMTDEESAVFRNSTKQDTSHHRKSFTHTVKEGESLAQIAEKYNLEVEQLKRWNNTNEAIVATQLMLKKPEQKKLQRYTVKSGDTLKKIAQQFGCSVNDIRTWNGLQDGHQLQTDDILWIKTSQ